MERRALRGPQLYGAASLSGGPTAALGSLPATAQGRSAPWGGVLTAPRARAVPTGAQRGAPAPGGGWAVCRWCFCLPIKAQRSAGNGVWLRLEERAEGCDGRGMSRFVEARGGDIATEGEGCGAGRSHPDSTWRPRSGANATSGLAAVVTSQREAAALYVAMRRATSRHVTSRRRRAREGAGQDGGGAHLGAEPG